MKTALLIIDVQRGLFDPEPRPFEADQVMRRINQLAAQARAHSVPVVFIQHESREGSLQFGSDGWQLAQELDLEEGDVVLRKTTPDSFLRTELAELLQVWEVEQVVVCGYASEFCVDTTVRRAAAQGLDVVLVEDAHTTHDKAHMSARQIREHHNRTLPSIRSFGSRISALPAASLQFNVLASAA